MFLPGNSLEAMFVRRMSPTTQLLIKSVSDSRYKNNGAVSLKKIYYVKPVANLLTLILDDLSIPI